MRVLRFGGFLLFAGLLPCLAAAQAATYQLKDGTTGTGQIHYLPDGTRHVTVQTTSTEKTSLPADQLAWFTHGFYRFVPVTGLVMRFDDGKRFRVTHDFARVADSGRVNLFVYDLLLNPSHHEHSYLLQPRGHNTLLVIRDQSNRYDDGAFSPRDRKVLLKVFGDDPNLRQLLAQQKLTCRNFPAYVRAYNEQFGAAR